MRAMRWPILVLAAAALVAAGCGGTPPPKRGRIHGRVTLDGKPVARGNVRFIALEANGVNVLAPVKDGAYDVPESDGPVKGKYRVEFSVPSGQTKKSPNPDIPGEWLSEPVETLPARYHKDSEFTLDYDPANPQPYNGELRSR